MIAFLGGIPNLISIDPVPQFDQDPKQRQGQVPPSPQPGGQYSPHQNPGSPSFPPNFPVPFDNVDPIKGLAFLEYIRFLLEVYPLAVDEKPKCDLTKFGKCTCVNPPEFTQDGRGNCNLGKKYTSFILSVRSRFFFHVDLFPCRSQESRNPTLRSGATSTLSLDTRSKFVPTLDLQNLGLDTTGLDSPALLNRRRLYDA